MYELGHDKTNMHSLLIPLNDHADEAKGLYFLSVPSSTSILCVYARREGSGKTVCMCSAALPEHSLLTDAISTRLAKIYQNKFM